MKPIRITAFYLLVKEEVKQMKSLQMCLISWEYNDWAHEKKTSANDPIWENFA